MNSLPRWFGRGLVACGLLSLVATSHATTFSFTSDPFTGSTALLTPGRQIVGGEASITFNIATDVFAFDPTVFGLTGPLVFANDVAGNLPTSGANVIVLQSLDDDANGGTAFGAGNAANLIASRVTSPGAGFFIYFNSGLDVPRLVYSTDLNDNTADLKILARMTNLSGAGGRSALPTFTAANFQLTAAGVPDGGNSALLALGAIAALVLVRRRR